MVIQQAITLENSDKKPIKKVGAPKESTESITAAAVEAQQKCKRPVKLTWTNVSYSVMIDQPGTKTKQEFQVIKNVSGYALPGQVLYIMGASGAGKTSLLNIISDRISMKSGSKLTGDVLINDKNKVSSATFGTIASFVMQDDILFEFLTVREALTFAARLRLSSLPLFE